MDFDEYIRHGEPDKQEKASLWRTAIGLQAVDGLETSSYLKETARRHIEGEITIDQARQQIKLYYQSKTEREPDEDVKQEADKVSANITVYANEVTGISISPSPAFVAPTRTLSLTASLAKTNYGEISSLSVPSTAIGWASQQTSYVTVSPDTGASTVATGVALGESQVTAMVDSNYMQSGVSNTATCTVTCTNSTSGTGTGFTGWN